MLTVVFSAPFSWSFSVAFYDVLLCGLAVIVCVYGHRSFCACVCVYLIFLFFSHLSKFTGHLGQHSLCSPCRRIKVELRLKLKKEGEEMAAIPLCVHPLCVCVCVWVQLKLICRQRIGLLTNTSAFRYINAAAMQMAKFRRET